MDDTLYDNDNSIVNKHIFPYYRLLITNTNFSFPLILLIIFIEYMQVLSYLSLNSNLLYSSLGYKGCIIDYLEYLSFKSNIRNIVRPYLFTYFIFIIILVISKVFFFFLVNLIKVKYK